MKQRYIACMLLHAVGDTVGFKNGEWELKKGNAYDKTLEKLYEFVDLGGVNDISLDGWRVSDDTIMHIKTAQSILNDFNSINSLGKILKKNFLIAYEQFNEEGHDLRHPEVATTKSLDFLSKGGEWNTMPYNLTYGGSGASMRSLCIGLAFYGEENRDKLIQIAIESGRITNNSSVGFLGAFASALFVALAIEGKKINDWPFILLELVKSKVNKYIRTSGRDIEYYERDHHIFIEKWYRYIEDKFDVDGNVIIRKSNRNLIYRGKYYQETFGMQLMEQNTGKLMGDRHYNVNFIGMPENKICVGNIIRSDFIGSGGDDSVIIAYDCLLDSGNNWEKLIIYSMMHMGDTDTTGAITGGLYGILHGFKNVPDNFIEHLEYKNILEQIGEQLYDRFYK